MKEIERYLQLNITYTSAVVCYLKQNDEVLLGLRKKVSLGLGENLIAGIGGKVGDNPEIKDETFSEALIRECREEIGIKITSFEEMGKVRFIFPHKPKWNQVVKVYVVSKWEGIPQETEAIKPLWYKIDELPKEQMWDDNSYWVPKVLSGEKINIVFLYGEDNKVKEYEEGPCVEKNL